MKAVVLHAHGGAEKLKLEETGVPTLEAGQVLVRIVAASVNPIDLKIRAGLPIGPSLPAIIGCDFSGVVEAVNGAPGYEVGDEVYGCAGGVRGLGGSLAEFIACDPALLSPKPKTLTHRQSAALPLVGITAWLLNERSGVKQGDHVLVHGGVGGVGHVALQIAKTRGARVATTVKTDAAASIARDLGADDVILYGGEEVSSYVKRLTDGRGFDVVIDTVGGANLDKSFQAAASGGRVAGSAARSTHDLSPMHGKGLSLHIVFMLLPLLEGTRCKEHGRILEELAAMCDAGKVKPLLDPKRFDLARASEAHAYLESGKAVGKVVVNVSAML
ncbi:NADPH2:quinone reductase [Mesorhizobium robiniae]|uniref:NADPH2:quinone reductase n=1 Tax=Mesorhizobium robiniae TaxID=559315 RepID=A0ABV2H0E5_9HYPH|nr:zinc-binding dehydrogenase [Mesorhizobium sp. ZC-5]MCV3244145.1 zinc-binding dehydrogenase [Mesorhizobium sp. ZC-5]